MKLRLGFAVVVAMAALGGACDKKTEEVPVQAAPVESAPVKATEPEAKAEAAEPAKTEAPKTEAKAENTAVAAEHAGCAEHAAKTDGDEANCPFPEEKAAAVEGCGSHTPTDATKNADGSTHFGTTFALTEAKPLGSVLAGATDGQELNVRVSGTIEKVCQKKGCWMVVKDGDVEARVVMKDHAFTVPVDAKGKPAQVEGTLKVRVFTEAQAKHLAEDGGEDPTKVTGEKKELQLTATAVEIGG